jgi:hypothetical protein
MRPDLPPTWPVTPRSWRSGGVRPPRSALIDRIPMAHRKRFRAAFLDADPRETRHASATNGPARACMTCA